MYRKLDRPLVGIGSFTYDILSGGSANVIEYDVQRLVEAIYEQKAASLMTIDGSTAVGKTRLSKFLAARLNRVPRDLDDYLLGDGRPYALQIDYEKLKRDLMQAPSILSGICILHVLKRAGLESNVPIYLVRTDENNPTGIPDSFEFIIAEREESAELPTYRGINLEIWLYHRDHQPISHAKFIYISDGNSIPDP